MKKSKKDNPVITMDENSSNSSMLLLYYFIKIFAKDIYSYRINYL